MRGTDRLRSPRARIARRARIATRRERALERLREQLRGPAGGPRAEPRWTSYRASSSVPERPSARRWNAAESTAREAAGGAGVPGAGARGGQHPASWRCSPTIARAEDRAGDGGGPAGGARGAAAKRRRRSRGRVRTRRPGWIGSSCALEEGLRNLLAERDRFMGRFKARRSRRTNRPACVCAKPPSSCARRASCARDTAGTPDFPARGDRAPRRRRGRNETPALARGTTAAAAYGIRGLVRDLLEVDRDVEAAVEAVLAERAEAVVVDGTSEL